MEISEMKEKLTTLERRVESIEHILNGREVALVKNEDLERAKHGAKLFLELSERQKGKWKGPSSALEEVKKMRKYRQVPAWSKP